MRNNLTYHFLKQMKFKSFVHTERKKVKNEDGDNWFLIECKRYYYSTVVSEKTTAAL